ncbi:MAG: T9SS type A sorting domain-containing protein [Bacteroidales bacterium]|nr:T9SS type A sorting domain-containing protein [Bacteroidales bacterium]
MKKLVFSLSFLLSFFVNYSQSVFAKVYEQDMNIELEANSIAETPDSNLLLAGNLNNKPCIIKTDVNGSLFWARTFGNNGSFNRIIIDSDSTFIATGYITEDFNNSNVLIIRAYFNGDTIWIKELEDGLNELAYNIEKTSDSCYIISGFSSTEIIDYYGTPYYSDLLLAKIDAEGNTVWFNKITDSNPITRSMVLYSTKEINDSVYFSTGFVMDSTFHPGRLAMLIVKSDNNGNIEWVKRQSDAGLSSSIGYDLFADSTGILFMAEQSSEISFIKMYINGDFAYSKKTGQYADYEGIPKLHTTKDSSFIVCCNNGFTKFDVFGNPIFSKGINCVYSHDCIETYDKGFVHVGSGPFWLVKSGEFSQISLVKTDSLGTSIDCTQETWSNDPSFFSVVFSEIPVIINSGGILMAFSGDINNEYIFEKNGCVDIYGSLEENSGNEIKISPNPAKEEINIEGEGIVCVEILSVSGKKLIEKQNAISNFCNISLFMLPRAMYFVRISTKNGVFIKKLMVY